MKKSTTDAVNAQIHEELFSEYLYLAMSAYAGSQGLRGIQNWFAVQAREERDHAQGFMNHLIDRGGVVVLQGLAKPPADFKKPSVMFQEGLKHEQHITACIHALLELATKEKDYPLQSLLKWYVDEQIEEEANAQEILDTLKLVGESGAGLYQLDKELLGRTYTQASILAGE